MFGVLSHQGYANQNCLARLASIKNTDSSKPWCWRGRGDTLCTAGGDEKQSSRYGDQCGGSLQTENRTAIWTGYTHLKTMPYDLVCQFWACILEHNVPYDQVYHFWANILEDIIGSRCALLGIHTCLQTHYSQQPGYGRGMAEENVVSMHNGILVIKKNEITLFAGR